MPSVDGPPLAANAVLPRRDDAALRSVAMELETTFLSVMLKEAGIGKPLPGFGGGIGEEQFGSFLRDAYAAEFARTGGIGLAESIFRSLADSAVRAGDAG